jgi:hypothetical protein
MERKPAKQPIMGLSGRSYVFEVHDFGASFTNVSAVYVLAKYERGAILPLYIGETGQLEERLGDCLQGMKYGLALRSIGTPTFAYFKFLKGKRAGWL